MKLGHIFEKRDNLPSVIGIRHITETAIYGILSKENNQTKLIERLNCCCAKAQVYQLDSLMEPLCSDYVYGARWK